MLRAMEGSDLQQVLNWRNDPSIRSYMYTQHEISEAEHEAWWVRAGGNPNFKPCIYEQEGRPMGYVGFTEIVQASRTATWGFYTAPSAPQGTGSLMTFAAMDFAFGCLRLRKLSGEAIGSNQASIGLHRKFGFKLEGILREHVLIGDLFEDVHRFALFAQDWHAVRAAKARSIGQWMTK